MSTEQTIFYFAIFLVVLVAYLVLANMRRLKKKKEAEALSQVSDEAETQTAADTHDVQSQDDSECCGQHEVCEKTTLLNTKLKPEYYDDEELDVLSGREVDSFTPEEIVKLREVFETLLDKDVAGWLRSLQLREIELPEDIKEEALLIVGDLRARANEK